MEMMIFYCDKDTSNPTFFLESKQKIWGYIPSIKEVVKSNCGVERPYPHFTFPVLRKD